MMPPNEVAEGIYLIDAEMYSIPRFTSVYLVADEKIALIESGPSTSAEAILDGIRQQGVDPQNIAYIVVTHIHLDHAGGAGTLIKHMPQAQVLVHEKGAKHLVDPSKLMESVKQTWGEDGMQEQGSMLPIEAQRVHHVNDGDVLELGRRRKLTMIHAPGHAPHEICIYDSKSRGLFTGDAAGIYFPKEEVLVPTTPPPGFDLDIAIATIKKLMEIPTDLLLFSHFGVTRKVRETLVLAIESLEKWGKIVWEAMAEGDFNSVVGKLREQASLDMAGALGNAALCEYMINSFVPLCATGYMNHYQKKSGRTNYRL